MRRLEQYAKQLDDSMASGNKCDEKVIPPIEDNTKDKANVIISSEKNTLERITGIDLRVLAFCSAIIGVLFWSIGFSKYLSYDSGGSYPYEPVNAYVGGDAYNYIINGTYFTAFSIIGGVFILGAFILYATYYLKK